MSQVQVELFVYGSLMSGQSAAGLLGAHARRPATMRGHLWRLPAGYPLLVLDPNGPAVRGEVVQLDDAAALHLVDVYEGVGSGPYQRLRAPVGSARAGAPSVDVWVYAVTDPRSARRAGAVPLRTSDWRKVAPRR